MDCDGGCPEHTCLSCCNDRRVQLEQQVEAQKSALDRIYDNVHNPDLIVDICIELEERRYPSTAQQGGEE